MFVQNSHTLNFSFVVDLLAILKHVVVSYFQQSFEALVLEKIRIELPMG